MSSAAPLLLTVLSITTAQAGASFWFMLIRETAGLLREQELDRERKTPFRVVIRFLQQ